MNDDTLKKESFLNKLFEREYDFPFKLLLIGLFFECFRPDRLIAGGKVLMYLPLFLTVLLIFHWLQVSNKILNNTQTKFLFGFVILIFLQIFFARNPKLVFNQFKSFFLYGIPGYLVAIQFINTFFKLDKFIRLYVIFGIFFATMGLFGGGIVVLPVLDDENDFSLLMNFLMPFAFFLALEAKERKKKIFYSCIALLFITSNVATFSRGGFVGLVAVGLFLLYVTKTKLRTIIIFCLILSAMLFLAPTKYWDEMRSIETEGTHTGTGKARIENWKAGWRMFLDHPIIGVGADNYPIWLPEYHPIGGRKWGRAAHSLYLTLLPELGIVGTLLFFSILWGNYKDHRYVADLEKRKEELLRSSNLCQEDRDTVSKAIRSLYAFSLAYSGALIAYLVTGAFISVFWYGYLWSLTCYFVITANIGKKIEEVIVSTK